MPYPKKPTLLKALANNPGGRPLNKNEPIPEKLAKAAPSWFNQQQKDLWNGVMENAPHGLITSLDENLLAIWCVACQLHREATENVSKNGIIIESPKQKTPMQNPYLCVINRQSEIMMRAAGELGFTPVARSRISLTNTNQKSNNRFSVHGNKPAN